MTATSALAILSTGEARRLLAMGASEEAVAAYSFLIAIAPEHHTLYISRARARYLSGDTAGAIEDLAIAQAKKPADPLIERLCADISVGRKLLPPIAPSVAAYKEYVHRGNTALASGDGDAALQEFQKARDAGLYSVFAAENDAMAMLLCGRFQESRTLIANMSPPPTGPFVRAQAAAIVALADALEGRQSSSLAELERWLAGLQVVGIRFIVAESPLQFLIMGLQNRGLLTGEALNVASMLRASGALDESEPDEPREQGGFEIPPSGSST